MTFHVDSEVGQLRQVILHRPGLELSRLTPQNIGELLFDACSGRRRPRKNTTASQSRFGKRELRVHYYAELLAEVLEISEGRAFVLDRICTPEILGPTLVRPLRRLLEDLDGEDLATCLVGGVLKSDMHPAGGRSSLKWEMLRADDFLLAPLPNHLFQRDNSCWIYGGVSVNPMAKPARQRETLHSRAHLPLPPALRRCDFVTYIGDDDLNHLPASVEGGDVHVIGTAPS